MQAGIRGFALHYGVYCFLRHHCGLAAEAHQADCAARGAHRGRAAQSGGDTDEQIAWEQGFDHASPLPMPMALALNARQIDAVALAQQILLRYRLLTRFAANGVPILFRAHVTCL